MRETKNYSERVRERDKAGKESEKEALFKLQTVYNRGVHPTKPVILEKTE